MKTFTDSMGREWSININYGSIKRVRALVDVDLLEVAEGKLKDLATDPILLINTIFALCKPQADAAGIGDEDFGNAMRGDVIEKACAALFEDLADFFPKGKQSILKKLIGKSKELQEAMLAQMQEKLDGVNPNDLAREILTSSSGDSLARSA